MGQHNFLFHCKEALIIRSSASIMDGTPSQSKRFKLSPESAFKPDWEIAYFCVESGESQVRCLICKKTLSAKKKFTVDRHYATLHKELYKDVVGEERQKKLIELKSSDDKEEEEVLQADECRDASALRVSYKLALNIAIAGKPLSEGEFIKKNLIDASEIFSPSTVPMCELLPLSRHTISRRIKDMADDVHSQLKQKGKGFQYFSVALDESTDISNTAQLSIYLRGVDADLNVTEEFLDLISMKGTTTGEDILNAVEEAVDNLELNWETLASVTTDGAKAMCGTGKGFVGLLRKKLNRPDLPAIHCLVHQQALCAKSANLVDVMSTVVSIVNYLRAHALNHREFQEFLSDLEEQYSDVPYHTEVRWLSRGKVLRRFYDLLDAIALFIEMKGRPEPKLENPAWIANLAFLLGITEHLNRLNLSLQAEGHLITTMADKIKSFEKQLELWESQLASKNTTHFPELGQWKSNAEFPKYVTAINAIRQEFSERFQEFSTLLPSFDTFVRPFSIEAKDVRTDLQLELIELQCDTRLRDRFYGVKDLMDFYRIFPKETYPRLHREAAKLLSMFGSTYVCERFFSAMKYLKPRLRSTLSDENLRNQLRLSVTRTIVPNISAILGKKKTK